MQPLFGPVPEPGILEILLLLVVGLGVPVAIAGLLGKVVLDRWRGRRPLSESNVGDEDAPVSGNWWWIIASQPVGYLLLFVMSVAYALLPVPFMSPFPVPYVLIGLLWLLKFVAPVAVYFDRKYVAAVSDWSPSLAYYLVILPVAGVLLAAIYVYERHEHAGVP